MNKINQLFANSKDKKLLSLYFCAGCPTLDGTADVILTMQRRGIAMIEVGIPFSDPLADGPVIQSAATQALKNGMSVQLLFDQLKAIKDQVEIPLVLMGYLNPILHFGIEAFCQQCVESGVSGVIIPDLPFADYQDIVKPIADRYDLRVIMLITPETSEERIRFIDDNTDGFIYMVSSAAITGVQKSFDEQKQDYFRRINAMHRPSRLHKTMLQVPSSVLSSSRCSTKTRAMPMPPSTSCLKRLNNRRHFFMTLAKEKNGNCLAVSVFLYTFADLDTV